MPIWITKHKTRQNLKVSEERLKVFENWLFLQLSDMITTRTPLESVWRRLLSMYEAVPKARYRDVPIEDAPNTEITIGAIASDSIYAQIIDLIFGVEPFVTCRPAPKKKEDKYAQNQSASMQRFANHIAQDKSTNLRDSVEEAVLDDVQLGTFVYYIPWQESKRKTRVAKIVRSGPRIYCIPIDDVFVRGGTAHGLQDVDIFAVRFWRDFWELSNMQQAGYWDIDGAQPAGAKDWLRQRREMLGRSVEGIESKGNIYDIFDIHCFYDIDGDGITEEIYCVWNQTGRKLLAIDYNPYDQRPFEKGCYQRRAHMFYGLGVMEMMQPYEEEITEVHNFQLLNALLANARIWKGKHGSVDATTKIWPGKFLALNDPDDLKAEQMADVYPSLIVIQRAIMELANRRVGVNDLNQVGGGVTGSRTPGITMMSLMQQMNKRFTPAFDAVRNATSGALIQCLHRYAEQIKSGNARAIAYIYELLGDEDGRIVYETLRSDDFTNDITLTLTASSASVNREADRQDAVMLMNILTQYYTSLLQLVMLITNPEQQVPKAVKNVVGKIIDASSNVVERTVRTFDQVRDPSLFVIDMEKEMQGIAEQTPPDILSQLGGMLGGMGGGQGQEPLALPFGESERQMLV